jgi:hypothetical protein
MTGFLGFARVSFLGGVVREWGPAKDRGGDFLFRVSSVLKIKKKKPLGNGDRIGVIDRFVPLDRTLLNLDQEKMGKVLGLGTLGGGSCIPPPGIRLHAKGAALSRLIVFWIVSPGVFAARLVK